MVVSGVGGEETAEATLLLDLVVALEEGSIASAAFLFLSWEEMVSTVEVWLTLSGGLDSRLARLWWDSGQMTQVAWD